MESLFLESEKISGIKRLEKLVEIEKIAANSIPYIPIWISSQKAWSQNKINQTNISTKDFIEHVNKSNIPQQTLRDNLDKNIVEELLSTLISTTLIDLEVKNFDILISEETLSKKIKFNKNFHNENGNFERLKYEKFLLENNESAPAFELKLRGRELQKNLFDYIGAGTTSPKFLTKKLYEEENSK